MLPAHTKKTHFSWLASVGIIKLAAAMMITTMTWHDSARLLTSTRSRITIAYYRLGINAMHNLISLEIKCVHIKFFSIVGTKIKIALPHLVGARDTSERENDFDHHSMGWMPYIEMCGLKPRVGDKLRIFLLHHSRCENVNIH